MIIRPACSSAQHRRLTSTKADSLLSLQSVFNTALTQHLYDEEEIIVPAALHFGYIR